MDDLALSFGLFLFVVLTIGGVMLLTVTGKHRQTLQWQIKLFLIAMLARFAASLAIYAFGLVSVLKDEDSSGWVLGVIYHKEWTRQMIGILDLPLVLGDAFTGTNKGYFYLLGALFHLTDAPGRLPAAALNCFMGALTVVLVYRVARSLFPERVARRVGWWSCFFPSLIIWSAQTVKEPIVILLETLVLYGCVNLKISGFSIRHLLLCAAAIVLVTPFRFYAAYLAGFAVLMSLVIPQFSKRKITFGPAVAMAVLVLPLVVYSGVLVQHEREFEKFDIERIEKFKYYASTGEGGRSGVQMDYDLKTPGGFTMSTIVGAVHLLLAPFPWQLGGASLRMLLTLPEVVFWWWLFFVGVIPGFWYAFRHRFSEILPLLIFCAGLGLLYSVMFSNVGLAYRQRAQLLPWLLIMASVGWEIRQMRREATRRLRHASLARHTPVMVTQPERTSMVC